MKNDIPILNIQYTDKPCLYYTKKKLIFANKDKKEIKQIVLFLYLVYDQLSKIKKEKLDLVYLKSDEFYVLFKKTLDKIKYENKFDKIQLFRNFILKSAIKGEGSHIENNTKNYILNKLEGLTLQHFQILDWYFQNNYLNSNAIGSEYHERKNKELPNITPLWSVYENDLDSLGFLHDNSSGRLGGGGTYYYPSQIGKIFYKFIRYDDL